MDEKRLEFPCTKQCLVYASCRDVCTPYRDYVKEAYTADKYRCFKIVPPPPKQIQELAELINRVKIPNFGINYFPSSDVLIIHAEKWVVSDGEHYESTQVAVVNCIRMRKDIKSHKNFPEELK